MNAAHDSAKHSAGKVRIVPNKRSATGQSRPLVFDLEIGEIDEKVHSRLTGKQGPRRLQHSCRNFFRLQRRPHELVGSEIEKRYIFSGIEPQMAQGEAGIDFGCIPWTL